MTEMTSHLGGDVLRGQQAADNALGSEHLFGIAIRPANNARRTYLHGRLASSMPWSTSDGFITPTGRRVYVSDTAMCDLREHGEERPRHVPCRVVKAFYDAQAQHLAVVVRCFRNAEEVLSARRSSSGFKRHGLVRVWEEVGGHAEITLRNPDQVLDLIEVLTAKEPAERKHDLPWACGESREGWSFVCEGFVTAARRSQRRYIGAEKGRPWRRSGASDENVPGI